MLLAVLALIAGLVLLTRAADEFVVGAARLSLAFNMSPIVVGAVIVGFGTSAPEMLVSGIAANNGDAALGVGNVVGSNAANLTLVLGAAALLRVLPVDSLTLRREALLSTAAVVAFALAVQGDGISRTEGFLLIGGLVASLMWLLIGSGEGDPLGAEAEELADDDSTTGREVIRTVLGIIGTLLGAQALVWGATEIANEVGLSDGFVGLTLVAIGTSLPELVTSIAAARKNQTDLVIGNLLGSNLFNSFAVGAVIGFLHGGPIGDDSLTGTGVMMMVIIAFLAWLFMFTGRQIARSEAVILLAVYALTVIVLSTDADADADGVDTAAPIDVPVAIVRLNDG